MRVIFSLAAAVVLLAPIGCSLGQGVGEVHSDRLVAHDCWGEGEDVDAADDDYDLGPDFFAAVPYRETLQIRVQRGNDIEEVSDGLSVLIDDVDVIRGRIKALREAGSTDPVEMCVALPAGVTPPGSPVGGTQCDQCAEGETPLVHMSLYLHRSCHNQNTVLYAVCGKVKFSALFSADPQEKDAAEKLIDAPSFDVLVGDPRDTALGASPVEVPEHLLSRVTGYFSFYFERGQPGQPFP